MSGFIASYGRQLLITTATSARPSKETCTLMTEHRYRKTHGCLKVNPSGSERRLAEVTARSKGSMEGGFNKKRDQVLFFFFTFGILNGICSPLYVFLE